MGLIRNFAQILGLIASHAYMRVISTKQIYQGPLKATCVPFLSCHACPAGVFSCPIGTIQHYMIINQIPFILLGHIVLISMVVGRMACGWLCPFGLIQDILYKIKSIKITISKSLGSIKYFVLGGLVILIPYLHGEPWFCRLCPNGTLESALPWVIWNPVNPEFRMLTIDPATLGWLFALKIFILFAVVLLIVAAKRPFCRIFCPLGIIFGLFNRFSLIKMQVEDTSSCGKKCDQCLKRCPMNIKVYENPNSSECIRCLECTHCKKVKFGLGKLDEDVFARPPLPEIPNTIGLKKSFAQQK